MLKWGNWEEFNEDTIYKPCTWLRETNKGVKQPKADNTDVLARLRWESAGYQQPGG